MAIDDNDALTKVVQKLDRLGYLEDSDRDAVRALPFEVKTAPKDHFLIREGDEATDCCVLLEGYACRTKTTSSGGRQIVSFHMSGDILDLQLLLLSRADHNIQAITDVTFASVPAADMRRIAQEYPRINEALWRDTMIDASVFREWVLNVGRRDSKARVAHMLCEFAARRVAAGLGSAERFELPMTQQQIADATGLTPVIVSRTLYELGQDGVILRDQNEVEITDWARFRDIADFDRTYLHSEG